MRLLGFSIAAAFLTFTFSACSDSEPKSRTEIVQDATMVLKNVRDRESADRAANKFSTLIQSLDKFEKTPTADAKLADSTIGSMVEQVLRLKNENFYGSELLQKELGVESGE